MQQFQADSKHKVLILDDEPLISESLSLIFRQAGFEPRVAYSAELALNLLGSWHPAVAIVDIGLVRMDGVAFALRLKDAYPDCKLLLFSGRIGSDAVIQGAQNSGLEFVFLEKPVQPAVLLAAVKKLLRSPSTWSR